MNRRVFLLAGLALLVIASVATAQFRGRSRMYGDAPKTAREVMQHSNETPAWTNATGFKKDVWTFVRIRYQSGSYRSRGGGWATDYPDADLNISWRVQQMTSMKVDPDARVIELTDPELFSFPFIYIVEPGGLTFTDEEVPILRQYLLNGGFLMVDDFWGVDEWENFAEQIKRVFPDRAITDLPRAHPIFSCVFPLPPDLNLQLPSIGYGRYSGRADGVTWETNKRYDGDTAAHFRGIHDDKGRLCVVICHNTDNGDGWEREGENEFYFHEFSEKKAYPFGINIFFYSMTH